MEITTKEVFENISLAKAVADVPRKCFFLCRILISDQYFLFTSILRIVDAQTRVCCVIQ